VARAEGNSSCHGCFGPAIQDRANFGGVPTTATEQTTISGEAGLKSWVNQQTVRFDLTGYWYRTRDIQLSAAGGAVNTARLLKTDKAIGYGVEPLDAHGRLQLQLHRDQGR
jgi:iron complex outermembrane receptor protein